MERWGPGGLMEYSLDSLKLLRKKFELTENPRNCPLKMVNTYNNYDNLAMIIDPGQLDVDLSRPTEEKSMIATDTTMDNLSQHTIDDEFTRTLEDDIELEAECRGKIEFETAEDQLSILTHKLEHEMDELAKLEEEVVKEQEKQSSNELMTDQTKSTCEEVKVEMNEDTLTVSQNDQSQEQKQHQKKQKNK